MAFIALLTFVFNQFVGVFEYDKTAILAGEYWRLLTGHFFHTNGFHLLLNLAGLTLLTFLHWHFYHTKTYLGLFIFCSLFISIALLEFSELSRYVGLSGVLHGIFAWGALKDILAKEKTGIFLYLGLWVKVVFEQLNDENQALADLIEASVAIDAHLWGALAGTLYFLVVYFLTPVNNDVSSSSTNNN
ncbi:rhombosortase [Colwellia sp. MEBiC06753]